MMISCVSPSSEHLNETLLTLNYARKTANIVNEPQITFNQNGDVLVQEAEEFRIIKKQNDILIRENKDLRREIQAKMRELEQAPPSTAPARPGSPERRPDTLNDSRDVLIRDYERRIIDLNKGFSRQKSQNLLLAKQMEVG